MPSNKDDQSDNRGTSSRGGGGFASMDEAKQREIASKGGRAAHEKGTAHEFTPDEAREAGRKGGEAVSQDREHMAEIGAKGGHASHGGRGSQGSNPGGRSDQGGSNQGGSNQR